MLRESFKYKILLIVVTAAVFFFHLDVLYINLMETRNMLSAREMITSNHWILTTMNDLPRYEKPPLPTWITAVFGYIFGFENFNGLRLPASFISLLTILVLFDFTKLLKISLRQSFICALILATGFYMIFSGRTNQWDIYTHGFMLVSIYFFFQFLQNKQIWKNIVLAGIFCGFSFMSKGPVSLYALFLPFLLSYALVFKFKYLKEKIIPLLLFVFISFIVGGWWFIYVRIADPDAFVKALQIESSRWGNYNVRPFYYYWSFFVQSGIWTIPAFVSLLFPYLKNKVSNRKVYVFALLWTLFSVFLLSLIPEKKARYLLPVLIPLAITTSFYIEYLFRKFKELSIKETAVLYFYHGLISLVCLVFPIAGWIILQPQGTDWIWFILISSSLLGAGIGIIINLKRKNYPPLFYLNIFIICAIITFGFGFVKQFYKNPLANNISALKQQSDQENFPVYEFGIFEPRIIWEYGEAIPNIDPENPVFPEEKYFGIIFQDKDMQALEELIDDYDIIREERFDNNFTAPDQSSYRDRLIRNFFLLKKRK